MLPPPNLKDEVLRNKLAVVEDVETEEAVEAAVLFSASFWGRKLEFRPKFINSGLEKSLSRRFFNMASSSPVIKWKNLLLMTEIMFLLKVLLIYILDRG